MSQGTISWDTGYWVLEWGHSMPKKSANPSGTPQKSLLGGPGPGWPRTLAAVEPFWTIMGRRLREQINGHAPPSSQLHPHFIPRPKVITVHSLLTPQKEEGQALNLERAVCRLPQTLLLKGTQGSCLQQHLPWTQSTGLHHPLYFSIRCHTPFCMSGIQERIERLSLSSKTLSS